MGRHPFLFQELEYDIAHYVVHRAFSRDLPFFLAVKSGRVVFVVYDVQVWVVGFKYFLCFSFIELF